MSEIEVYSKNDDMIVSMIRVMPSGEVIEDISLVNSISSEGKFMRMTDIRGNMHFVYADSIVSYDVIKNEEDIASFKNCTVEEEEVVAE